MPPAPDDLDLSKLLEIKKVEKPPPDFFKGLSRKILAEIKATPPAPPLTRWQTLIQALEGRPLLAIIFSVLVCGLLAGGLMSYSYFKSQPAPSSIIAERGFGGLLLENHATAADIPSIQPKTTKSPLNAGDFLAQTNLLVPCLPKENITGLQSENDSNTPAFKRFDLKLHPNRLLEIN